MTRLVILAPNWLGDAVMALPAMTDVQRGSPGVEIAVAARASIAPLFGLVPFVHETIVLSKPSAASVFRLGADLADGYFDAALLLPNSLRSALEAWRADIPERWGYRTDCRGPLLTRAVDRPPDPVHQAAYYQHLVASLGFEPGPLTPRIDVPPPIAAAGRRMLEDTGWNGAGPIVALAPGAAYGGAKRWPPEYYAALASRLHADGIATVIVGSAADRSTADEILAGLGPQAAGPGRGIAIDLVGATDLPQLAGVLANCRALVSNDSGAMHVGAAVGLPVTAVFGPTNDAATGPLPNAEPGVVHQILTEPVDCRPCMLRECPIDHRCMRRVLPERVYAAVRETL